MHLVFAIVFDDFVNFDNVFIFYNGVNFQKVIAE